MAKVSFLLRGISNERIEQCRDQLKDKTTSKTDREKANSDLNTEYPILLTYRCKHSTNKYVRSMDDVIEAKHWSVEDRRVRPSGPGALSINGRLDAEEKKVTEAVRVLKNEGRQITPENIAGIIAAEQVQQEKDRQSQEEQMNFFQFVQWFIDECEKENIEKSDNTVKIYKQTLTKLKQFSTAKKRPLDWDSIDKELYREFTAFLRKDLNHAKNSIGTYISKLKFFLNEASDSKRCAFKFDSGEKKHFKVETEETDSIIALSEEQIMKIWNVKTIELKTVRKGVEITRVMDIDEAPEGYRIVRDKFVSNCYIGLRISDYRRAEDKHMVKTDDNVYIKIKQQKTWSNVYIPVLNPVALSILERYNCEIPEIEDQVMNRYLKVLAKGAGLDEVITMSKTKGGKRIEESFATWQKVTTHTARKSWATNLIRFGVDPFIVRSVGGWKSEKAFLRYVKITPEEMAKLLVERMNAIMSRKVLSLDPSPAPLKAVN